MLTDMIVEEEFEVKEAELVPWYAKQDLEHDLHLAAELGKSLLERNKELEQGLQQMYSTNQEQLQEIEYLTKQVELLRQVNEQHTKVYEQLDLSARELEQNNQRLGLDNRAAQQKIQGLLETAETLQSQVEELQREVEELKTSRPQPRGTRSVSCLSELRNTRRPGDHAPAGAPEDPAEPAWREEERASLQRSLRSLQTKLAAERARREEAERDADLLAGENAALERQLGATEGCRARLDELECEAEELRQLWRVVSSAKPAAQRTGRDPPPVEEEEEEDEEEEEEESAGEGMGDETRCQRRPGHAAPDAHERSCLRRSDAVKYRGISLLNEVDAQYSALQDKYDALLRRCSLAEPGGEQESQSHKAVQTAPAPTGSAAAARTELAGDFHQPEYKALFKEIFSCIQRTREDLRGNSGGVPHGSNGAAPIPAGTHGELVGTRNDRALSI